MTISLYTDTFCTVANADLSRYLIKNSNWNALQSADKEKYLKSATKIINWIRFRGERQSDSQALEFKRTIERLNYPEHHFTDAYIEAQLAEATSAQVAYDLAPLSLAQIKGGIVLKEDVVCHAAREILREYIQHFSPTMYSEEELI